MKTSTAIYADLHDLLSETRLHEANGWAVRQIIIYPPRPTDIPPDSSIIVVFEKDL